MLRPLIRRWTFLTLAALLASGPALAQAPSGRLAGVVRDARGPALGAATVTATNRATGAAISTRTASDGSYALGGLAAGPYTVTASLIGFRRGVRTDVLVAEGETTIDFALEPVSLQRVVVTATLREQALTDVPFSIAAPSAEQLRQRGAETIEDVAANVAGFSVQNLGPGQSQVAIRGASSGQVARDQPGVKEEVGAYLDDSPISLSLFTPDLDLFDLSRIEVLRGPQGTLFGAGSLAGTVRYITNQPELGVRATFGEVGGSWVDGGNGGGSVKVGTNAPFGERAAGRVVVYHNRLPGWMQAVQPDLTIHRNDNSGTRTGVRAALRWDPSERLSVVPRLVYQNVRMNGWNRIDTFNILANPYTTSRPAVTLGERKHFTQIGEPFSDDFVLGDVNVWRSILVVRDAGALTSSITGGTIALPEDVYTLNAPLDDSTTVRVFSQELRLSGNLWERGRWLVGGFYAHSRRNYGQGLIVSGFQAATGIPTEGLRAARDELFYSDLEYRLTQSALFGEATLTVLPPLDVTAGLRYYRFDEDRDQIFDGIFAQDNTGTSLLSVPGSTKADGFAPRFMASLRALPNVTLNAVASRGFRLGGINDPLNLPLCQSRADSTTFSGHESWQDETAWNYEAGIKSQWLDGRASLNLSAFYMDIRDLQLVLTAGTCSSRLIFNVPKAVSRGTEVELSATPNEYVDFALSATFDNSELRSTVTTTDTAGVVSVVSGIKSGNRLPSVPKVQAAAALTLGRPMGAGGRGFVTGSVHHIGSRYTQIDDLTPGIGTVNINSFSGTIGGPLTQNTFTFDPLLPAYTIANVRVGLRRDTWETALFVNNVTDERAFLALDRERGLKARVGYLTNQPRTFGVTTTFRY